MAQKHLHELLKEDQEPFVLKNYIADRRCQVKTSSRNTQLQAKKRKPNSVTSSFPNNLCKNACFLSFNNTQDITKSPLFEFSSPGKSTNAVFIHVPARTASLLLEAAVRIQKNSTSAKQKPQKQNTGFGMFGSILKRLKQKSKTQKKKIQSEGLKMLRQSEKSTGEMNSNGRLSSAGWSESNEEKSFDMETSSSSSHFGEFCDSPFHFVLERSQSSGRRTPELSSPGPYQKQDKENFNDVKNSAKFQGEQEEEEKEQNSPVSILDPPFEDDEDRQDYEDDDEGFDLECSYEFVERAKQQLLQKLCRFEKLAELDPVELEKRILEQEHSDNYDEKIDVMERKEDGCGNNELYLAEVINEGDEFVLEVLRSTSMFKQQKVSRDMNRLVSDLIAEELQEQRYCIDSKVAVKRVCKRLESWNEVEFNTIDMMVEQDLKREHEGWKSFRDQEKETASEVELAIFGLLIEELAEELVCHRGV